MNSLIRNRVISIYVKQTYTTNTKIYKIPYNANLTMGSIMRYVTRSIPADFNIPSFEIIDVSLPRNRHASNGRWIAEEDDPISYREDESIIQRYKLFGDNSHISFYVRPCLGNSGITIVADTISNELFTIRDSDNSDCCMICFENIVDLYTNYNCCHRFCLDCIQSCRNHSIIVCPVCRSA